MSITEVANPFEEVARELVSEQLVHHQLPWRVEGDWTNEVTASDGHIVAKCSEPQAAQIIWLAQEIQTNAHSSIRYTEASSPFKEIARQLVSEQLTHHKLPWIPLGANINEVTASDGYVIAKCSERLAAQIIELAGEIQASLDSIEKYDQLLGVCYDFLPANVFHALEIGVWEECQTFAEAYTQAIVTLGPHIDTDPREFLRAHGISE